MRALCIGLPAAAAALRGGGGLRESEMGHQVNTFKRGIKFPLFEKILYIPGSCQITPWCFRFPAGRCSFCMRWCIKIHAIRKKNTEYEFCWKSEIYVKINLASQKCNKTQRRRISKNNGRGEICNRKL